MARPRKFDELAVLDAATGCFRAHGYEATSVRALIEKTGLTWASLYNAFGEKRVLYRRALNQYVAASFGAGATEARLIGRNSTFCSCFARLRIGGLME